MKRVLIIDNFLKEPDAEWVRARNSDFKDIEHRGLDYPGIAEVSDPRSEDRIREIIGQKGGRFTTIFRRYLPTEKPVTFIHNDCQLGLFSAILFLTRPDHARGGVAFWRHRLYGWEGQPAAAELAPRGLRDTPALWESVHQDGFDEFKWEMVDYVPVQFNRLIIFLSSRYHSRYPKEATGETPDMCRMIKTFFFQPEAACPEK
jgi:hypothetical protein